MTIELPVPVANYFSAARVDSAAAAAHFTEDAVVLDEGRTYRGRSEIERWRAAASNKYQYTSEPLSCEDDGRTVTVTSRLTGNFPGSPVDITYRFQLVLDKIAVLETV